SGPLPDHRPDGHLNRLIWWIGEGYLDDSQRLSEKGYPRVPKRPPRITFSEALRAVAGRVSPQPGMRKMNQASGAASLIEAVRRTGLNDSG
ncbi:MAG: hypothetical protein WCF69_16295, partial [Mycobacterium sp.]